MRTSGYWTGRALPFASPEERRAYQRERYARNRKAEQQRGRAKMSARRAKEQESYDAEDYAEEFEYNTLYLGMSARAIVSKSKPAAHFFRSALQPESVFHCICCGKNATVLSSGASFPECSAECRREYLSRRHSERR